MVSCNSVCLICCAFLSNVKFIILDICVNIELFAKYFMRIVNVCVIVILFLYNIIKLQQVKKIIEENLKNYIFLMIIFS